MLFFYDRQVFKSYAARQRAAAKGGAVLSVRNRRGEMFFRQKRAERHSRGDRLGDGDDVRDHAEALEGKDLSSAPKAALDLVENERGLMLVGERPAGAQEIF